jgi:hypothetical protein
MPSVPRRLSRQLAALVGAVVTLVAAGCATRHPPPLSSAALAEAQTFPYFPVYWVGRGFHGEPLTAVDGRNTYNSGVGESLYYGDCVTQKGILKGGSCPLPLQVTTLFYQRHANTSLGRQYNVLIRGVPAAIFDGGRSIQLYTGQVAVNVFSDTLEHALMAAALLRPVNAPGSAHGPLPAPVYCPGISFPMPGVVADALQHLPGHICQRAEESSFQYLRLNEG